jgi:hypothetical protein
MMSLFYFPDQSETINNIFYFSGRKKTSPLDKLSFLFFLSDQYLVIMGSRLSGLGSAVYDSKRRQFLGRDGGGWGKSSGTIF